MKRKILILLLAFSMVLAYMPAAIFAQEELAQNEQSELTLNSEEEPGGDAEVKSEEQAEPADKDAADEVVPSDEEVSQPEKTGEDASEPEELKDEPAEEDDEVHPELVNTSEELPKITLKGVDDADDIQTVHITIGDTYKSYKYSNGKYWSVPNDSPASLKSRLIDKINGQALNTLEGVDASYMYCTEPGVPGPDTGTYNVDGVYDGTETDPNLLTMRKILWYMPGGNGWNSTTKARWYAPYEAAGGKTNAQMMCSAMLSHIYKTYRGDAWTGKADMLTYDGTHHSSSSLDTTWALNWIDDLSNLPDPPVSFKVLYTQESNMQDLFGALYLQEEPSPGLVKLNKTSQDSQLTAGLSGYSLAGAQYQLYKNQQCTTAATDVNGNNAVLTTTADGSSNTLEMEFGTYYTKEIVAPPGHKLSTAVTSVTITENNVDSHIVTLENGSSHTFTAYRDGQNNTIGQTAIFSLSGTNGTTYTGTCRQQGNGLSPSGTASVVRKIDNNSKIAKVVYKYGVRGGWWGTSSSHNSANSVLGISYSNTVTLQRLIEVSCQIDSQGVAEFKQVWENSGANMTTVNAMINWYNNVDYSSEVVPDAFEMYYVHPADNSQDFAIWNNSSTPAGTGPAVINVSDEPIFAPPALTPVKESSISGTPYTELLGTQITIKYYNVTTQAQVSSASPVRQWTFATVKKTINSTDKAAFDFQNDTPVSGDAFYVKNNQRVLPIGWFTIEETRPPAGYESTNVKFYGRISPADGSITYYKSDGNTVQPSGIMFFDAPDSGSVTIHKTTDKASLASAYPATGVKFTIYTDSACTSIAKDRSNNNCANIPINASTMKTEAKQLAPGTYYIKETTLPNYFAAPAVKTITLASGEEKTVEFQNVYTKGKVKVKKTTDCTAFESDYSVTGVKFSIYTDSACTNLAINTDGTALSNLTLNASTMETALSEVIPGTYYIKETNLPDYLQTPAVQSVTIAANDTKTVTFQNKYKRAKVKVKKTTDNSQFEADYPANTVTFTIYKDSACTKIAKNSSGANCSGLSLNTSMETAFSELMPGTYYIKENNVPTYFETPAVQTVTLAANDEKTFTFQNKYKKAKVKVKKTTDNSHFEADYPANPVKFNIYTNSACTNIAKNSSGANCSGLSLNTSMETAFSELIPGTYYIKETNVPDYFEAPSVQTVTLAANDEKTVTLQNKYKKAKVKVKKTTNNSHFEADYPANTVTFTIYTDSACTKVAKNSSGANCSGLSLNTSMETAFSELIPGTYYIKEANVPDYFETPTVQTVTLAANDEKTFTFQNKYKTAKVKIKKTTDLPQFEADYPANTVTFTIYKDSACTKIAKNSSGANCSGLSLNASMETAVSELIPGTYYIKEANVPTYFETPAVQTVTLAANDEKTFTFQNKYKVVDVEVSKLISNPAAAEGNSLYGVQGTVFKLYKTTSDATAGTNEVATLTIATNGKSNKVTLIQDTYYLVETKAGQGLLIPDALKASAGGKAVVCDGQKTINIQ